MDGHLKFYRVNFYGLQGYFNLHISWYFGVIENNAQLIKNSSQKNIHCNQKQKQRPINLKLILKTTTNRLNYYYTTKLKTTPNYSLATKAAPNKSKINIKNSTR
jgi:hypothetical protein